MNTPDDVVITSVGLLTPWGVGLEAFLAGLASGADLPAPARCPEVDLSQYLPSEKTYLDRCSQSALVAAALALAEGGLLDANHHLQLPLSRRERGRGDEASSPLPSREGGRGVGPTSAAHLASAKIGLGLGTAYGCLDSMYANTQRVQTRGARLASPLLFMHSFVNAPASLIAIEWGIRGPGATFTDGGLSAASALYWACDLLRRGSVDMMLVGGVEALSEPLVRSLVAGRWLLEGGGGDAPVTVPAMEGAALLLLERAPFAEARRAAVLAEVAAVSPPTARAEERRAEHKVPPLQEAVTPLTPPAGKSQRAWPAPGEFPYYAFGAQFALRLASALGELRNQPCGAEVVVHEVEGFREAKAVLRKP